MIAAVLLAAGESRRMGQPKLTLPWGEAGSVIAHVVGLFRQAGADPIIVVTGGHREAVEGALRGSGAMCLFNADYRDGGMLSSVRVGLGHLQGDDSEAALLGPSDLPSLTSETIHRILERWQRSGGDLIVPSYQMRRGHPVLIGRRLWPELLDLNSSLSLRDFLRQRADGIDYVMVDDPGVIVDLDTPGDYAHVVGSPEDDP